MMEEMMKRWAREYNTPSFVDCDPIKFPRKYMERQDDAEISGLLTALISFGRREQILKKAEDLDKMFDGNPFRWIAMGEFWNDIPYDNGIFYRTITNKKMIEWCIIIRKMITEYSTIENFLIMNNVHCDGAHVILSNLMGFNTQSANKRIAMFLRWMVNDEGNVDLGLWKARKWQKIPIPLDTHVHRMALELGITKRKSVDRKTAMEITEYFEKVFPNNPLLGDFALFGYGVNHSKVNECD